MQIQVSIWIVFLVRFCSVSYLWRWVSVQVNLTKYRHGRSENDFRSYGELCNFIYCLLLKSRHVSALPAVHEWEQYMDPAKVAIFHPLICCPSWSPMTSAKRFPLWKRVTSKNFKFVVKSLLTGLLFCSWKYPVLRPVFRGAFRVSAQKYYWRGTSVLCLGSFPTWVRCWGSVGLILLMRITHLLKKIPVTW